MNRAISNQVSDILERCAERFASESTTADIKDTVAPFINGKWEGPFGRVKPRQIPPRHDQIRDDERAVSQAAVGITAANPNFKNLIPRCCQRRQLCQRCQRCQQKDERQWPAGLRV